MPGNKLPKGTRVEYLPTRIFEEVPEDEYEKNLRTKKQAVATGNTSVYDAADRRNRMLDAVDAGDVNEYDRLQGNADEPDPRIEKRDALFERLRQERTRDKVFSKRADERGVKQAREARRDVLNRAEDVRLMRDRNGMLTEVGPEMAKRPTGWYTVTRADGRRVRVPQFNPQGSVGAQEFIDTFEEEQPRFLDSVLSYLRD